MEYLKIDNSCIAIDLIESISADKIGNSSNMEIIIHMKSGRKKKFMEGSEHDCEDSMDYLMERLEEAGAPFLGVKPRQSISLCVYADNLQLKKWISGKDTVHLHSIGHGGLRVLEQGENYTVYIDKNATFTTVNNYVAGTYQEYLKIMDLVENNESLLKMNNIVWTPEDASKAILKINEDKLKKFKSMPLNLEPLSVPTTYGCCFRVDKNGDIYVGEGYENIFWHYSAFPNASAFSVIANTTECHLDYHWKGATSNAENYNWWSNGPTGMPVGTKYSLSFVPPQGVKGLPTRFGLSTFSNGHFGNIVNGKASYTVSTNNGRCMSMRSHGVPVQNGQKFRITELIISHTSKPMPFVKRVMPTGKMQFMGTATPTTHSFILKGGRGSNTSKLRYIEFYNGNACVGNMEKNNPVQGESILASKHYANCTGNPTIYPSKVDSFIISNRKSNNIEGLDSFKQILIYKEQLTQENLIEENSKDIKLS